MRKKRRSSSAPASSPPSFTLRPLNIPTTAPRGRWNYAYTLERIHRGQPNVLKLSVVVRPPRAVLAQGGQRQQKRLARVSDFLVNTSTGEIIDQVPANMGRQQRSECERIKSERRAAVLNSGHGGRNGARKYKPHSEC